MGDFEDVFGAGADADSIISGYSDDWNRASRLEKVNWWGRASEEDQAAAEYADEIDAWTASMRSRGYTKGPVFSSFEDLSGWERMATRPYICKCSSHGYLIYLTDGEPYNPFEEMFGP